MSYWQLIFLQSKVNSGAYDGDRLPRQNWNWPQQTWFQERLRNLRKGHHMVESKDRPRLELVTTQNSEYEQKKAT